MPLDIVAAGGPECTSSCFVPCGSRPAVPWHCVYTKPGRETEAEAQLRNQDFVAWLPQTVRIGVAEMQTYVPLFPRYLFVQFDLSEPWGAVQHTRGVDRILTDPTLRPLSVPTRALHRLWEQCSPNGVIYPPEPRTLAPGAKGTVQSGPFAQLAGICSRAARDRVWLLLELCGRRVEVGFRREMVGMV